MTCETMPTGDLPGWKQTLAENFDTEAALGQFETKYPKIPSYNGFKDTSKRGTYSSAKVLSAKNSILDYWMHTEDGIHYVAAPLPGGWAGQTYGRYSLRLRSDTVPGYKLAFMLWPSSNKWAEGEIDFPEAGLGGTANGYSHNTRGNPSQNILAAGSTANLNDWHTYTTEWLPTRVTFLVDGKTVGETTNPAGIPTTPMRWTLQAETNLGGPAPADTVEGHIQIDWVTVYSLVV